MAKTKAKVINPSFVILLVVGAAILSMVAVEKFGAANAGTAVQGSQGAESSNITPSGAAEASIILKRGT